ncbi:phosphoglycerate mutase [Lactobacillus hamsteri DSM 5661 = JCM 6256]|uniref:Phosphoglycerate mutase n=2 Tax=Lactobacillus hamsteri TaxID=96565 RepID=A0A0R1YM11_9LACO|nr:phosphoglycerate mutase [Lactobacillus hamsteri DSM 5661 = JCM 6256]
MRHGQTRFNAQHRMQGSSDSRLTKLGVKQVEATRDYFIKHGIEFNKAYCSTQERASETLEIVTNHQLDYERIKDLREKDYGFFDGKKNFLWVFHHFLVRPKVEDNHDVVERMERGMNLVLRDAQDGDKILVVGHGDSLSQYIRAKSGNTKFKGFQNAQFVKLVTDGQTIDYDSTVWPAKNVRLGLSE